MLKFICVNFGNVNFFSNFIVWFIPALSTQNIFSFSSLSLFSSCFYHFESISTSLHSICQMKLWSSCFCIFQLNFSHRCSYFFFQRISVFHDRSRLAHQTDEPECDHGETETLNSAHWAKNGGHVTYFVKSNYFSSKTVWMYLDNLDMIFDNS